VLRFLDIVLASLGLVLGLPILLLLYLLGLFDTGSPLFFQTRVGQFQRPFTLVKFRTMKPSAASVATHLADPNAVTKLGTVLRKTKLDELPQLWNVLWGDMSLVGPRPCLFNQTELISERVARQVFDIRPGITGLAQIQGIDMSTPVLLAETDAKLAANLTATTYFTYIVSTIFGAGTGDRIRPK
jgi:lipopolysaccharide/colanic/teichoic acid biosynthesis glycosyltransferase